MNDSPSQPPPEPPDVEFQIRMPQELEVGAYANFLAVWHTQFEFTLDFAVIQSQQVERGDDGSPIRVPCDAVARVKIPVGVVFDVLRALNQNMTRYEEKFGTITSPEPQEREE